MTITQPITLEAVGNYPADMPQIGTDNRFNVAAFSTATLQLVAIYGHAGTNNLDESDAPSDNAYSFTLSIDTSSDGTIWAPAGTYTLTPDSGHGPYTISVALAGAAWCKVGVVSNEPDSNADIPLVGEIAFTV